MRIQRGDENRFIPMPHLVKPKKLHPAAELLLSRDWWVYNDTPGAREDEMGMVKYRLNPVQRMVLYDINEQLLSGTPIREIEVKARQVQMTTFWASMQVALAATVPGLRGLAAAHETEAVTTLWDHVRLFKDSLEGRITERGAYDEEVGMGHRRTKDNNRRIGLENLSKLGVRVAAHNLGRSGTYSFVHLSEFDYYEGEGVNVERLMGSMRPTLRSRGWSVFIIESTVDRPGGIYNDMVNDALDKKSEFAVRFIPWFWMHGFDWVLTPEAEAELKASLTPYEKRLIEEGNVQLCQLAWRRHEMQQVPFNGDEDFFNREYPSCLSEAFNAGAGCVFSDDALVFLEKNARVPDTVGEIKLSENLLTPEIVESANGRLWLFEPPIYGHEYLVISDSAHKDAEHMEYKSNCAVQVFDRTAGAFVAEWVGQMDPWDFGDIVVALHYLYRKAMLVPENNGPGQSTIECIVRKHQIDPRFIYQEPDYLHSKQRESLRYGWSAKSNTKTNAVERSISLVNKLAIDIPSRRTHAEMRNFVLHPNGKYAKARRRDKDDLVDTLTVGIYIGVEGGAVYDDPDKKRVRDGNRTVDPNVASFGEMFGESAYSSAKTEHVNSYSSWYG